MSIDVSGRFGLKPDYEFDARMVIDGKTSPLCSVRLWLPIDCHDDVRIEVVGSANPHNSHLPPFPCEQQCGSDRIISEIDSDFGLQIEAIDVLVSEVKTKPDLKVLGFSAAINRIGRLLIKQRLPRDGDKEGRLEHITFHLSHLTYGMPLGVPVMDYLGNSKAGVNRVKSFEFRSPSGVLKLTLERHWRWVKGEHDRLFAAGAPVLIFHNSDIYGAHELDRVEQMGRDVSALLSLAARHLIAIHKMAYSLDEEVIQEWFSPLSLQRSTTQEEACGPLVDEDRIEEFFLGASSRWLEMTEAQKDAVRLAIFSIHPFVSTSSEGHFLSMFAALEGLARAWFPGLWKTESKLKALVEKFPPYTRNLWHLSGGAKDSLGEIRNFVAHGWRLTDERREALSVGTDHLQIWIERILLNILDYKHLSAPRDWLTSHVEGKIKDLPRLQASLRETV